MLTFKNLLRRINKEKLKIYSLNKNSLSYNMVTPFFNFSDLQDNTLYVGYTSTLNTECFQNPKIGFILIPDIPLNEDIKAAGEVVIWDEVIPFETLFNIVQTEFRRKIDLASNMSSIFTALIKGNSLKTLIDIATNILGNPIIVTNSAYKILAMSNLDVDEPFWQFAKTHGYCSEESISKYKTEGIAKKVIENDSAILLTEGIAEKNHIITRKLSIENRLIGYIGIHQVNKKFTQSDIDTIDVISEIISVGMKNDIYEEKLAHTVYEDIIIDLLNNEIPIRSVLQNRLKGANWTLKKYLYLIKIPLSQSDYSIWFFDYFYNKLLKHTAYSKIAKYHDSLVIIVNFDTKNEYEGEINNIIKILEDNKIKGGISSSFTENELEYLNIFYHQASKAYEIGTLLNENSSYMYYYEEIALYHLFSKIQNKNDLRMFCHPSYSKLVEYDKLNGTEYCKSIHEYMLCANNISAAAEKLFIHRNTMSYRINKISEITGLDLTKGKDIFKLYISLRIDEWLKL